MRIQLSRCIVLAVVLLFGTVAQSAVAVQVNPEQYQILLEIADQWPALKQMRVTGYIGWTPEGLRDACGQNSPYGIWSCDEEGWVTQLNIDNNLSSGVLGPSAPSMSKMKRLQQLYLDVTMVGPLDPNWSKLVNLKVISLSSQSLLGGIPEQWSTLTQLVILQIDSSSIMSGPFPSWITSLPKLQYLQLRNAFSGPIPNNLGNTPIQKIFIAGYGVSGTLPTSLTMSQSLLTLSITNTAVTGTLPASWSQASNLDMLFLNNNQFTGPLSSNFGTIDMIDLSNNVLTGTIPYNYLLSSQMSSLSLSNNYLSGPIPAFPGPQAALLELDLDNNLFTGPFPSNFWTSSLVNLNLNNLPLDNYVLPPISESALCTMMRLRMSSTNVAGSIPANIGKCPKLVFLDLSFNALNGTIPNSINNVEYLDTIDVSWNMLTGTIPNNWANQIHMTSFIASNNQLSGTIPASLVGLFSDPWGFTTFNLRWNNLSVCNPQIHNISLINKCDISRQSVPACGCAQSWIGCTVSIPPC